ncbi:hypothetical protein BJ508DRAFT_416831, partial [Ascobolus immersus RN42]
MQSQRFLRHKDGSKASIEAILRELRTSSEPIITTGAEEILGRSSETIPGRSSELVLWKSSERESIASFGSVHPHASTLTTKPQIHANQIPTHTTRARTAIKTEETSTLLGASSKAQPLPAPTTLYKTYAEVVEAHRWTERSYYSKCGVDGKWYPRPCQIEWGPCDDGFQLPPDEALRPRPKLERLRPRRKKELEDWDTWRGEQAYFYQRFLLDYYIRQVDFPWDPAEQSRLEFLSRRFVRTELCKRFKLDFGTYSRLFLIDDMNRDREFVGGYAALGLMAMCIKWVEEREDTQEFYSKMFADLFRCTIEEARETHYIIRLDPPSMIAARPRPANRRHEKHIWIVISGLEREDNFGLEEMSSDPEDLEFAGGYKPEDDESDETDDEFFGLVKYRPLDSDSGDWDETDDGYFEKDIPSFD